MAKIFSILTLIIAAGAAYLGMESKNLVQALQDKGAAQYNQLNDTKGRLTKTEGELKTTKDTLATAQADLEKSRTDLATATTLAQTKEKELKDIQDEISKAFPGGLKDIGSLKQNITEMTTKLSTAEAELTTAKNSVKELETTVNQLKMDKDSLTAKAEGLEQDKKKLEEDTGRQRTTIDRYQKGIMAKSTRGRVLAVNAGWGFCVISIGDKQGAAANKTLVVVRGGRAIGKVKITNVEATQSIADILPGTFARNTYVQPGDEVIYTGDEKVTAEEDAPGGANSTNPALPTR
jgi:hypothetical protein